jgi:DNA-binding transcriptional MerR regulator
MRKAKATEGLMRISELAKAAGVSSTTIHYYVREGLLFPATKTARNMAYYKPECVENIRLIKELQSKRFLPLNMIKLIMKARQDGQDVEHVIQMRSVIEDVFHPVGPVETKSMTRSELIDTTGLSAEDIKNLETIELLTPTETTLGRVYDDIDIQIANITRELKKIGLKPADLSIYRKYIEVIREEIKSIHGKIQEMHGEGNIPVTDLFDAMNKLKECLTRRTYRQVALEPH